METTQTTAPARPRGSSAGPAAEPCLLVIFGAAGDLTKRLLMPALYNLRVEGQLSDHFAIIGLAREPLTTESFREAMARDIRTFHTRKEFEPAPWDDLCARLYYLSGTFDDAGAFARLKEQVGKLGEQYRTGGNVLFYMATPPSVFGLVSGNLVKAGFKDGGGWRRIIVEKPFGTDLASARALNREILSYWDESQIYRVDHYLGKETVQNLLAFRFANGMFEPVWNRQHIDHVQLNVAEAVGVEGRGGYYDHSGVLRDMIQNHMLQMLAYLAMEPPASFSADDVRDEKSQVLRSVRTYSPEEALRNTVRGQYGAGHKADGKPCPAYRDEPGVAPQSTTETYAAVRLFIDNWRWDGVPFYLRSGKALWKRGTEIVVQFKKAPAAMFRGTAVPKLAANRLIFHIQPDQAIETLFQAKVPGPVLQLQPVNMRFSYGDAFRASRATGYEVMLYSCMQGDATLFSRTDLVERAWQIAQPILDAWASHPPTDFPNYPAGTWGPKAAAELIERDGRRWFEIVNRETLARSPLFAGADPLFLSQVSMALRPRSAAAGEILIRKGDVGHELYLIANGEVEVLPDGADVKAVLRAGDIFGEVALLFSEPRTATVRARTPCDLFVLEEGDFSRILREHEQFARAVHEVALARYNRPVANQNLMPGRGEAGEG